MGRYRRAIEDHGTAIRLSPNWAAAHNNRGIAYRHQGEDDGAIADYAAAIELKPDFGEAYFNRGLVYEARRDRDQAIADFQAADRLLPYHRSIKTKLRKLGLWPSSGSQ